MHPSLSVELISQRQKRVSLSPFMAGTASNASLLPSAWHTVGAQYMWVELNLRLVSAHLPVPLPFPTFMGRRDWTACSFPGEPLIIPAVTAMQASGRGPQPPLTLWSSKHRPLTFYSIFCSTDEAGFSIRQWSRVGRDVPLESHRPGFKPALPSPTCMPWHKFLYFSVPQFPPL